jgi:hypothetical protein
MWCSFYLAWVVIYGFDYKPCTDLGWCQRWWRSRGVSPFLEALLRSPFATLVGSFYPCTWCVLFSCRRLGGLRPWCQRGCRSGGSRVEVFECRLWSFGRFGCRIAWSAALGPVCCVLCCIGFQTTLVINQPIYFFISSMKRQSFCLILNLNVVYRLVNVLFSLGGRYRGYTSVGLHYVKWNKHIQVSNDTVEI